MYAQLLAIPNGTVVTLTRRGETISGCLVFNPFRGTGRLLDVDREVSYCFAVTEIERIH